MQTKTVTLGTLIDRALLELQGPADGGRRVVVSAEPLGTTTDNTVTFDGDPLSGSDLVELGSELVLVTAASSDQSPVYTVARGYYGTTPGVWQTGTVGTVNPAWPRVRIAEAVRRALPRLEALGLPLVQANTFARTPGLQYVQMPESTRQVLEVGYFNSATGRYFELDGWRFYPDVPTTRISTGKMVRLPGYVDDSDDLEIIYRVPYRWSTEPVLESSTVELPEGAEDLPAQYAAAWLVSSREVSRADLSVAEEWNRSEPQRGGVSLSLVRSKWQEFYRSLDEARRLQPARITRPYVKTPRMF